ncbi:hypothetical protein QE152_g5783 [Popillia japonica]|uniref:Uncharacterized protein n=1 Tax=Popillia japonica TaxID=7064 RepID=A0AAW1MLE5_POPJA
MLQDAKPSLQLLSIPRPSKELKTLKIWPRTIRENVFIVSASPSTLPVTCAGHEGVSGNLDLDQRGNLVQYRSLDFTINKI